MWSDATALISIAASGGTDVEFAAAVETIDIDQGDKEFDAIATTRGGRLRKQTPEEPTMITFEGYPVSINTASTDVMQRFMDKRANWDTSQPLSNTNTILTRDRFRVVVMWTEDTSVTAAVSTTPASTEALRFTAINCQLVSVKPSYTDNGLKFTFKFKVTPTNSAGTANLTWESTDGTSTLPGIGSYTSS